LTDLISRHRRSGLVVDTIILLVRCVGGYLPDLIPRFSRTRGFTATDYKLLLGIWSRFSRIWTTPSILAEVTNLIGQPQDAQGKEILRSVINTIALLEEEYVPSKSLTAEPHFITYGLTDTAIAALAKRNLLVLTDDFKLSQFLTSKGLHSVNFNHLRNGS
jgi:hypothetical protein